MINYKNKKFTNYIDLEDYMIRIERCVNEKLFTHSYNIYIKYLLENKFKKEFSVTEIRHLLKQ